MKDSDHYDEGTEDALLDLDAQLHDSLHYARTSLEERNRSEAKGDLESMREVVDDIKRIDASGSLDIWNDYATYQEAFLEQLRDRVQNGEYVEAIEMIDKMVFLSPLAFDDDDPNHRHPDEW